MSKGTKAFLIFLAIIFVNIPLALFLRFCMPDIIAPVMTWIAIIEVATWGIIMSYMAYEDDREYSKNSEVYIGRIKEFKFVEVNKKWLKAPIVTFDLDGKKHEVVITNYSINGFATLFLKNHKIKIFYNPNNPTVAKTTSILLREIGVACFVVIILFMLSF